MADDLPNWNLNILDPMDNDSKSRFIDVSKDDFDELIAQQENEKKKKKTMYDLNIVLKFLREVRKEERELEKISPEELNVYLSEFIIAARTKKGEQYEPSSLGGMLSSVGYYLTMREYGRRLFIDPQFTRLRDALKAKQKELKNKAEERSRTQLLLSQRNKLIFSLKKWSWEQVLYNRY